jgi:hypothetical protein
MVIFEMGSFTPILQRKNCKEVYGKKSVRKVMQLVSDAAGSQVPLRILIMIVLGETENFIRV